MATRRFVKPKDEGYENAATLNNPRRRESFFQGQRIAIVLLVSLVTLFAVLSISKFSGSEIKEADVLVLNSRIWTGRRENGKFVWAEGMAIKGGRIAQVGDSKTLQKNWKGREVIDGYHSNHKMILPGFADCHTHILMGGYGLTSVQLRDAPTKEEFVRRIEEFTKTQEEEESWLTEGGWNHELWGGQLPTRHWIDGVTRQHPAFLCRLDGHMCLANTKALKLANVNRDTEEVDGGVIVRDEDGEPTGILKDKAMDFVLSVIPAKDKKDKLNSLRAAMKYFASNGVTVAHHMGTFDDLSIFEAARKSDELFTRIHAAVPLRSWEQLSEKVRREGRGDRWLSFGSLKAFTDGSFGSQTAYMFEPYGNATSSDGNSGLTVDSNPELTEWIVGADAAGLQCSIHAIGDRANDILMTANEVMRSKNGVRDRRFRIEHAQSLRREDVKRMKKLDIIASMQPYHLIDDGCWIEKVVGHKRAQRMFPFREMLDEGIKLAFGSDWFVAPPVPLIGIYAAVTRATLDEKRPNGWIPEQKITVEEALEAYTQTPAYATFRENQEGKIQEGFLADFVLLDQDLTSIHPRDIRNAKVLQTFVEGKRVFSQ